MDIRVYFQKIREVERTIQEPWVVVVSLETPEGGKPGRATEVSRGSAAQLIVDNKVRLADVKERDAYYKEANEARLAAEEATVAGKIHVTVVSDTASRASKRPEKG
ncbi:MAG TPA: hypothetical protein VEX68_23110 [Bryobacteraceae bacterium]|nr:hypothetical protein [Bryobacteraceae bacterium]